MQWESKEFIQPQFLSAMHVQHLLNCGLHGVEHLCKPYIWAKHHKRNSYSINASTNTNTNIQIRTQILLQIQMHLCKPCLWAKQHNRKSSTRCDSFWHSEHKYKNYCIWLVPKVFWIATYIIKLATCKILAEGAKIERFFTNLIGEFLSSINCTVPICPQYPIVWC